MNSPALALAAQQFIQSVLDKKPQLAVFDCDGTLWQADSGEQFMHWEIEHGLLPADISAKLTSRYGLYKDGEVGEDDMCGEMVTIHEGIPYAKLMEAAREFIPQVITPGVFPEMQVLTNKLRDSGCDLWAISSTNDWVVREGVKPYGIPGDHVIAACVDTSTGVAGGKIVRMPSGEGKAVAIREVIKRMPEAVFGNSKWDVAMLELAKYAYAINPNPDLEALAKTRGWTIYKPAEK